MNTPISPTFDSLKKDQTVAGFKAVSVYIDDTGRTFGARFQHLRTGFTLDLLQIQSAAQAFTCVKTWPTSNMGEPHTQEHLLLGKGEKGLSLAGKDQMALVTSTAATWQTKTCYSFNTAAGTSAFFPHYRATLDALLHPNYSDEEIRREVRNFGIAEANGQLHLEEKGTVYNEMTSSMDQANRRMYQAVLGALYGPEHPESFSAGGLPAALRNLQPADIRRFHAANYFLANIGSVVSLPKEVTLNSALTEIGNTLNAVGGPATKEQQSHLQSKMPAPRPADTAKVIYAEYPYQSDQQPSGATFLWPAQLVLNYRDKTLINLFLSNVAGGAGTNLYKRFIDSKTREFELGARTVSAGTIDATGAPVTVQFSDLPVARLGEAELTLLRAKVVDEFEKIAAYADGSSDLAEFHQRLKSRVVQQRRALAKLVNSPPGFGNRGGGATWFEHLKELNDSPDFRKSVTMKADLDFIESLASGSKNVWRDYLKQWKLLGTTPAIVAAKPNPALVQQAATERDQRIAEQTKLLQEKYNTTDAQMALARYKSDYDKNTDVIDAMARKISPSKFVDNPPMSLDESLDYAESKLPNGVPLVASKFEGMTSALTGLAMKIDGVPSDRLVYLSMLPQLLTATGVVDGDKPIPYETALDRQRNEILSLNANYSTSPSTGRYELVIRGAGNNVTESARAMEWMRLALFHPNWRIENIARLRDLVDQVLGNLRRTTQGSEESWVRDPATAYQWQNDPVYLTTSSFMTRIHNVHRLRWMLKGGSTDAVQSIFTRLGALAGDRQQRVAAIRAVRDGSFEGMSTLTATEKSIVTEAARDLETALNDIPDSSLTGDWSYLCRQMATDLKQGPERTLAILNEVRESIAITGGARMFWAGSSASLTALDAGLRGIASELKSGSFAKATHPKMPQIDARLAQREKDATNPVFVGFLHPNSQSGVFVNGASLTRWQDTDRESVTNYLSALLYGGGGAHSVFSKTIGAGLAYSNGIGAGLTSGRISYYAERTPELPQTLKFVQDLILKAQPDAALVNYVVAGAFGGSRVSAGYESRAEAMAEDLADGITRDVTARFRRVVLEVAKTPNLQVELTRRMKELYARVLPGMGTAKAGEVKDHLYFVIGPEKQFAAYEGFLKDRVWRLYARDFWSVASN